MSESHVHQNKHRPNKNPRYSRATIYNDHPPLPGMWRSTVINTPTPPSWNEAVWNDGGTDFTDMFIKSADETIAVVIEYGAEACFIITHPEKAENRWNLRSQPLLEETSNELWNIHELTKAEW